MTARASLALLTGSELQSQSDGLFRSIGDVYAGIGISVFADGPSVQSDNRYAESQGECNFRKRPIGTV